MTDLPPEKCGTVSEKDENKKPDMLTRIEDAIIKTLKAQLPQELNRVESFDENVENYDFPQGDGGAVFTLYAGSTYEAGDDKPTTAYATRRTLRWQLFILVRSLNGKNGGLISAHEAVEAVRKTLQGQSVAGATPFQIISDKLDARIEGGWRWVMEFSHHIPSIAEIRRDTGHNPYPIDQGNKPIGEF
ncbi:Gp37 family protein [Bartonella apis]|uniref:Gp37 family protein n=1 Tax=Bartonella apis TaxID=1686310 RepID=UPI0018DE879A|nr:Gp37 family protein [Bartonella apis]MBI0177579.1 hypothetical protein [Bartonella apis]